jgi:hypothetical protein
LKLLREASKQDPSPAVRERLAAFAAERLHPSPGYAVPIRSRCRKPLVWLKPALAGMVLAVTGLTIVYVLHFRQHVPFETHGTAQESHPSISPDEAKVGSTMRVSVADRSKVQQPRHGLAQSRSTRRMTLQLPYSNSAIETGTDATIRVSMSESELLSLGFPINATLQDRRIAAELTLGDDGLPRAISLSLPLQVMKEKK